MEHLTSYLLLITNALALFFGGAETLTPREAEREPTGSGYAAVLYVIDGDTIGVSIDGTEERVRYIGIDAPEAAHDGGSAECYADEATAANVALVEGKEVRLLRGRDDRDDYGRLLRHVYVGDTFVNETLVRQGAAIAFAVPPNVRFEETFARAEAAARADGAGLWDGCR